MGPGSMTMVIERFEVYLVNLDPTQGREIQKTGKLFSTRFVLWIRTDCLEG